MSSLYLPYETGDTGARPLPPGVNFWSSPAIFLAQGAVDPSTYEYGVENVIDVVVQENYQRDGDQIPNVFVEVWVCDPATIVGPDQALYPSQPSPPTYPNKCLTGSAGWGGGFSVPVQVGGFVPWSGMSSLPGGHACLIVNCYGSNSPSGQPISDGQSLINSTTADFVSLVQDNAHVAQHNIFADAMSGSSKRHLSFPFNAVAAVRKGEERVVLEIQNITGDAALTKGDLAFLHKGRYRDLPLHRSNSPLKAFAIDGAHGGPAKSVPIDLHAGHPVPLSILVELGPGDHQVGGVHAFNVIQRTPLGRVQGGIHLLAVVT
jgi:hypothetical protein